MIMQNEWLLCVCVCAYVPLVEGIAPKEDENLGKKNGSEMEEDEEEEERGWEIVEKPNKCFIIRTLQHFL